MEPTYRTLLYDVRFMDGTVTTVAIHVAFRCTYSKTNLDHAIPRAKAVVKSWYGDRAKDVSFVYECHDLTFLGNGITMEEKEHHGKS